MSATCPDCGTPMEFEEQNVRLRTGACPACSKEFAFVEGATVVQRLRTKAGGTTTMESEAEAVTSAEGGPECDECGSPLVVRRAPDGRSIEVVCEECETTTVYVPRGEGRRDVRERDREAPRRFDERPARSRPCRQCGAPLRFSTQEDGTLVGECDSCGNRFELPARDRRSGGSRGPPGKFSYGKRPYGGRPGGGGRYSRGARDGAGARRNDRRRPRRDRRANDDEDDR